MTNKLQEAMDEMQASSDMYDRVLKQAQEGRRQRQGHAWPKAAVAVVALTSVLGVGGVAYAAVNSNFFQLAMGNHGQSNHSVWAFTEEGKTATFDFTRDYDEISAANVSQDLADAVQEVGYTAQFGDYTLTIESMVIDDNGCGMVNYTLTNPNGLNALYGYGTPDEVGFTQEQAGFTGIEMDTVNGATLDGYRSIYDADTSTDTELHATLYFADMSGEKINAFTDGVYWFFNVDGLSSLTEDEAAEANVERQDSKDVLTDVFVPSKVIQSETFSDDNGLVATLSPFSIRVANTANDGEFVLDDLTLDMSDGTKQTILHFDHDNGSTSGEINYFTGSADPTYALSYTMSRLVNVEDVSSISVQHTDSEYNEEARTYDESVQTYSLVRSK